MSRSAASVIHALLVGEGNRRKAAAALGVTAERVRQLIVKHSLQGWEQVIRFCCRPPWERQRKAARLANAAAVRRREAHRRAGLCGCGRPRDCALASCKTCRQIRSRCQKVYLQGRRKRGLCGRCPAQAVPGKSQCRGCLVRGAASQRERKRAQKNKEVARERV